MASCFAPKKVEHFQDGRMNITCWIIFLVSTTGFLSYTNPKGFTKVSPKKIGQMSG